MGQTPLEVLSAHINLPDYLHGVGDSLRPLFSPSLHRAKINFAPVGEERSCPLMYPKSGIVKPLRD